MPKWLADARGRCNDDGIRRLSSSHFLGTRQHRQFSALLSRIVALLCLVRLLPKELVFSSCSILFFVCRCLNENGASTLMAR